MAQYGTIGLKWDPKNLEIRTISVEKTLEPLVRQVTTLVSSKGPSKIKKGKSKRAHILVAAVERATEIFIENGKVIAMENPVIKKEMLEAVENVQTTGEVMSKASREFADDPCSSFKRADMVKAARNLLSAVTRLLILADMVDVYLLLQSVNMVEDDLEKVKKASSSADLLNSIRDLGASLSELMTQAMKRQQELKDPEMRDALAAARAVLKKNSTMLMTASTVYLRHPELPAAKANRDYVLKQVCEAVNTISDVAQGKGLKNVPTQYRGIGAIIDALDKFDDNVLLNPMEYNELHTRANLEKQLEDIINAAAQMAQSPCTRDERRDRILAECNNVKLALQDLLSEYMNNMGGKEPSEGVLGALDNINRQTNVLRRQLRKAVVDHVSDSFLETATPLLLLIEAAKAGNEKEVGTNALIFTEHANKLVEVADLACTMSANEEGVKMVRHAASQIQTLCPQVINAAKILAARPGSQPAIENMEVFRHAWENQLKILTEAVDDITTIDDFLAVSEGHILEDVNKCVLALEEEDADTLSRTADAIYGRSKRVCSVVTAEMDNYDPGFYTQRVLIAVNSLKDQAMPNFISQIEIAINGMNNGNKEADHNEVIHASQLVYDGVRDIRSAVLMNRSDEELDPDDLICEEPYATWSEVTSNNDFPKNAVTEEEKKHLADFRTEKRHFDIEVAKWDDTGNDVVVLAKHMCVIMMEMTDFTRGRGPLKTTMDVINAAKKISEAGTKLDKLTRQIADQCPESSTKEDLLAYLKRIELFCHQLNITSKVKADVQNISGELIVSGLDSATSLIQAAKNLMNAVVLTVKSSYVASTKYSRQGAVASPLVVWRMKAPEKKPLVRPVRPEEVKARVRRASQRKSQNPIKALTEFQSPVETV